MDGRMGRGKHKLRWGTDYEARAGYHYPSHRDRSTLQQPRLLNTPRFLSLFISLAFFLMPLSLSLVPVHDPPASCPDNAGVGNCKLLISPFPALHSSANMKRVLSERCETIVPRPVEAPPLDEIFLPAADGTNRVEWIVTRLSFKKFCVYVPLEIFIFCFISQRKYVSLRESGKWGRAKRASRKWQVEINEIYWAASGPTTGYPPTGRGRGEDDRKGLDRVSATQREQEKVRH